VLLYIYDDTIGCVHIKEIQISHLLILLKLDPKGNEIRSLPEGMQGAFQRSHALQYLSLEDNELSALRRGALHGLTNLQYLKLDNNPIEYLDKFTFADLEHVMFKSISISSSHHKVLRCF